MPTAIVESGNFANAADKKRLVDRLARVEGQLRGVQKMIEREDGCEKIAQQLAAARGGLNKAFFDLMACAFETKLGSDGDCPPDIRQKLADLTTLLAKYA